VRRTVARRGVGEVSARRVGVGRWRRWLVCAVPLACATSAAAAAPPAACSYLAPSVLERTLHITPIQASETRAKRERGASGAQGVYSDCTFEKGAHPIASLSLFRLPSASQAHTEFAAEIKAANGFYRLPHHAIHGPWTAAYEYGNSQTFALVGDVVVNLEVGSGGAVPVHPTAASTKTLTAQIARRLA